MTKPFEFPDPAELLADFLDGSIYDGPSAAVEEVTKTKTKKKDDDSESDDDSAEDDLESEPVTYAGLFKALRSAKRTGSKPASTASKKEGTAAGEQDEDEGT